jgi:hypothetical protein
VQQPVEHGADCSNSVRKFKLTHYPRFTGRIVGKQLFFPTARHRRAQIAVSPFSSQVRYQNGAYNSRMCMLRTVLLALAMATLASAQQSISFSAEDGGRVCADLYGQGNRAVVLAHGGRFNKES